MKPRLYDLNMNLLTNLRYATKTGYTHKFNDLWTASFYLPVDDDANDFCEAHTIIDIFDGEKSVGKYRILEEPEVDITAEDGLVEYSCEHVIAFLLNDVIDGYLELGGEEFNTRQVIEALLALQTVKRWKLGRCDFDYKFQHSWENTNLLDALFSVPTCFSDRYHWEFDTDSYPWTVNLVRLNDTPSCIIQRKRNCQYIKRAKDNSQLTTRLYCKGSGEGVNQLTIAEVNPTGKPYIDSDTIGAYGIRAAHYIDLTCTDAQTLFAKGQKVLEEIKHPRYTYSAKAVHLSKMTGDDWYHYEEGRTVRMMDGSKIDIQTTIIEVSKADIDGNPLDIDIVLSNKDSDVASAIDDLARRTAITAQYSQGATNLYSQQFADNADDDHPAVMKFFVPKECAKINSILLSWSVEKFRAYSRSTSAGGGEATTSAANASETIPVVIQATSSNGYTTSLSAHNTGTGDAADGHTHNMVHSHDVYAYVEIPSSSILVPGHTHTVQIKSHSHGISYGIYEGGKAENVTIKVDDTEIPAEELENKEMDIVKYLAKDSNGKINRGTWHTIEIAPDTISRIEANLFVQTFVTSHSGGSF